MFHEEEPLWGSQSTCRTVVCVAYPPRPDIDILDEIIAPDYIQHNPLAAHGLEGVKEFRVSDGLCREHWDAFRPTPGGAATRVLIAPVTGEGPPRSGCAGGPVR